MPAYNQAVVASTLVGTSATTLGTVPASMCWRITSIVILNYSMSGTPTTETFDLYIGGTTDQYLVKTKVTLTPGGDYVFAEPLILPAATVISAKASTVSKLTATLNAVEMHAP